VNINKLNSQFKKLEKEQSNKPNTLTGTHTCTRTHTHAHTHTHTHAHTPHTGNKSKSEISKIDNRKIGELI
jgi:hypothetical protein